MSGRAGGDDPGGAGTGATHGGGHGEPVSPDAGLANERTALAWERSGLAHATIAGLAVHTGVHNGRPGIAVPLAGVLLLLSALTWGYGTLSYRRRRRSARARHAVEGGAPVLALLTVGTAACALVALALVALS